MPRSSASKIPRRHCQGQSCPVFWRSTKRLPQPRIEQFPRIGEVLFGVGCSGGDGGEGFIQQGKSPSQIVGTVNGVQTILGDYEPDFSMGWSNEVNIGPVRLFGLIDWRDGGYAVNLTQLLFDAGGLSPDVDAAAERVNQQFGNGTSQYIQPTSFAKLRELTVSYRVPTQFVQSVLGKSVSGARLEFSGQNLFTWTHYKGLDPEVSNFGDQNINRSQDVAPYPPARSFFLTLGVDF